MEIYRIGSKIREERIRQKLSQEELSYGICAVSTLSRIETGMQKPGLKMEEALLERLGCSTENLVFFASEEEVVKHSLEVDMDFKLMRHEADVKKEIEEYEKLISEQGASGNLEKQHYLLVKASYDSYVGGKRPEQCYGMLKKAILLTMPDFKVRRLHGIRLMTLTEISILNSMAIKLYEMQSMGLAMKYMYFLVEYLERDNISKDAIVKRYPMLLVNLAMLEAKVRDFRQVLFLCQKGIRFCKEYGRLMPLAEFYYYKAVAYAKFGGIRKALENYEYAICLCKVSGRNKFAKQIENEYQNIVKCKHNRTETQHDQLQDTDPPKKTEEKGPSQPEEEQKTKSVLPV